MLGRGTGILLDCGGYCNSRGFAAAEEEGLLGSEDSTEFGELLVHFKGCSVAEAKPMFYISHLETLVKHSFCLLADLSISISN